MKKVKEVKEAEPSKIHGFYKGYEMKWLKGEPQHPDYKLVAEYEALKEKK
jgi:hypothetical protein